MSGVDVERIIRLLKRWRYDRENGYWIHELDDDLPFSDDRLAWLLQTVLQTVDEIEEEASVK